MKAASVLPQPLVRRPLLRPALKEELMGWLFAMPWIIGFLLFMVGPMLFSLYTSFTKYNIIADPRWIGLENYENLFLKDPIFGTRINALYAARSVKCGVYQKQDRRGRWNFKILKKNPYCVILIKRFLL